MVRNDALCPHIRHHVWLKKKRELSVLKLVRHFQALADRWRHAIFQSAFVLTPLSPTGLRHRRTSGSQGSAQETNHSPNMRESLSQQHEAIEFVAAVNAYASKSLQVGPPESFLCYGVVPFSAPYLGGLSAGATSADRPEGGGTTGLCT